MKYKIKKKVTIDLTLDSSETLMLTKGGKHTMTIPHGVLALFSDRQDYDDDDNPYENVYCDVEISVQMERNEQGRFNFITGVV
jgi:hypothetical protein